MFFFFKHKTAYEMRISDWSSDVCSSDLRGGHGRARARWCRREQRLGRGTPGRRFRLAEIPVGLRRIANPSHRAQSGSQDARSRVERAIRGLGRRVPGVQRWRPGSTSIDEGEENGRAAGRERGSQEGEVSVVPVTIKKKKK